MPVALSGLVRIFALTPGCALRASPGLLSLAPPARAVSSLQLVWLSRGLDRRGSLCGSGGGWIAAEGRVALVRVGLWLRGVLDRRCRFCGFGLGQIVAAALPGCGASPHFSPASCCGGGSGHVYCVALGRRLDVLSRTPAAPSGRAPCIHARLHRLATKSGEKSGLEEGEERGKPRFLSRGKVRS